eukprot:scaffold93850_cov63-Phaeocystis_antarctica.AAC.2
MLMLLSGSSTNALFLEVGLEVKPRAHQSKRARESLAQFCSFLNTRRQSLSLMLPPRTANRFNSAPSSESQLPPDALHCPPHQPSSQLPTTPADQSLPTHSLSLCTPPSPLWHSCRCRVDPHTSLTHLPPVMSLLVLRWRPVGTFSVLAVTVQLRCAIRQPSLLLPHSPYTAPPAIAASRRTARLLLVPP